MTSAILYSLIICVYMYLFCWLLHTAFSLTNHMAILITALFLSLHFSLFYGKSQFVAYLFGTVNLTCLYHYAIPAIVNISLVLYFSYFDLFNNGLMNLKKRSLLFFLIYMAIFSNVLSNIILTSYIAGVLLVRLFDNKGYNSNYRQFIKANRGYIGILLVWVIALFFEANGGRAHYIGKGFMALPVYETFQSFIVTISHINKGVIILGLCMVGIAVYLSRKYENIIYYKILKLYLLVSVISASYLILVCAKAGPGYINRSDVFFSFIIWTLLIICYSIACVVKIKPDLGVLVPCALLFFVIESGIGVQSFRENTFGNINPDICYKIDKALIQQIQAADNGGQTEIVLRVPKGKSKNNWPHPMYMGNDLSRTLYKHGLISKPIKVIIQPDLAINQQYHIDVPK